MLNLFKTINNLLNIFLYLTLNFVNYCFCLFFSYTDAGDGEQQEKRNKISKNSPQNVKAVWEQDDNSIGQLTSNFKQWSKDWTGIF